MTDVSTPRRTSGRREGSNLGAHIFLGVGGVIMIAPMLYQLIMSVSTVNQVQSVPPTLWPGELQWSNFAAAFEQLPIWNELLVSVVITVIRVVGQVVLCSLAGYAFARMSFRGKGVLLALTLAIIMVPSQVYLLPQYQIIQSIGLVNTMLGIALPGIFSAFGTFLMRQFFLSIPVELEEAARLDGANPLQIFWRVMLPLVGNGIWALAVITVLWSWNDLMWPLIVSSDARTAPLSVGLTILQSAGRSGNYPILMAASLLAMAPILILFVILQKRLIAGIASTGLK